MAVTYQSTQTASIDSTSLTVTKPTSTADGDLLVASFWYKDTGRTITPPSGWTLQESGGTNQTGTVYTKVAGGSEPADYTWSVSGAAVVLHGSITRVTGHSATAPINATTSDEASVTGSTGSLTYTYDSMAITPPNSTSNLLFFFAFLESGNTVGGPSAAGYAIATDNPTWTERFDEGSGPVDDNIVALATAVRSEQTSTGDFSHTSTLHEDSARGFAAAVLVVEDVSLSVTGTTGIINMEGIEGAVTGSANVTGTTGNINIQGIEGTVATQDAKWNNTDKSDTSPTINNIDKS